MTAGAFARRLFFYWSKVACGALLGQSHIVGGKKRGFCRLPRRVATPGQAVSDRLSHQRAALFLAHMSVTSRAVYLPQRLSNISKAENSIACFLGREGRC
jgi:hypothetical protein